MFYEYEPATGIDDIQDNAEYRAPDQARLKRERQAWEEAEREENRSGRLSGGCGAEIGIDPV